MGTSSSQPPSLSQLNSQPSMELEPPPSGSRSSSSTDASGQGYARVRNSASSGRRRGGPSGPSRQINENRRVSLLEEDDDDEEEDDGDDYGRYIPKPFTKVLKESEFCLMTKLSCGLKLNTHSQYKNPPSIIRMISQREIGMRGGNGFSSQNVSSTMCNFLPNVMVIQDQYSHKAFCGTYSQDGDYFLSACQDCKLRLYKTTGERFTLLRKIAARDVGWSILDTAFSPDGSSCVYSSWSDCIYLVHLFTDSEDQVALQLNPTQRRFCVFSLVFSHDGQEIMCGANDGFLYVYDLYSNQRTLKICGHNYDVNTVAYADNTSQILYSGSDDGLCKVWDRRTLSEHDPKPVGVLAGHMNGITYIEPRGDGRHFLSNSKDQSIKLWDVRKFSDSEAQKETLNAVESRQWDYRFQKVSFDYKSLPNLKGDTSIMTYRGHGVLMTLIRCHFSPSALTGQRYIYTGCARGKIFIYDALTGKPVSILRGHKACVRDVSWHPYKPELISTAWDGVVAHWQHKSIDSSDDDSDYIDQRFYLNQR